MFLDNASENSPGNSTSMEETTSPSHETQESCSDQDHTLPIIQKITDLSTKIQVGFVFLPNGNYCFGVISVAFSLENRP